MRRIPVDVLSCAPLPTCQMNKYSANTSDFKKSLSCHDGRIVYRPLGINGRFGDAKSSTGLHLGFYMSGGLWGCHTVCRLLEKLRHHASKRWLRSDAWVPQPEASTHPSPNGYMRVIVMSNAGGKSLFSLHIRFPNTSITQSWNCLRTMNPFIPQPQRWLG